MQIEQALAGVAVADMEVVDMGGTDPGEQATACASNSGLTRLRRIPKTRSGSACLPRGLR